MAIGSSLVVGGSWIVVRSEKSVVSCHWSVSSNS